MSATATKVLKLKIGEYDKGKKDANGAPIVGSEYTEIGTLLECEDRQGNKYMLIKLQAHVLNPSLYASARRFVDKASGSVFVSLFDLTRRTKQEDAPDAPPPSGEDDDIPF